jgi:hypothetical protein
MDLISYQSTVKVGKYRKVLAGRQGSNSRLKKIVYKTRLLRGLKYRHTETNKVDLGKADCDINELPQYILY